MTDLDPKRVVRVEIERADGTILRATGRDAGVIWWNIVGAFELRELHGMPYRGPTLTTVARGRTD